MAEASVKQLSPNASDDVRKSSTGRIIKRKKFDDDEDNDANSKDRERDDKEPKELDKKEKSKRKRKASVIQEEVDFSKWTSQDDLLLKEAVLNVEAFDQIAKTIKFSNKFSPYQVEARWRALMYDPSISGDAAKAMSQLPSLAKRVLWTKQEEQLLVAEASSPNFAGFQTLLEKNREKFHSSRTPKSLEAHFYRMKKAQQALQQQQPNPNEATSSVNNSTINTSLMDVDKDISNEPLASKTELDATVLAKKKEYEKLDGQQQEAIIKLEKDIQTNEGFAVLRTVNQRYVMKSKEIVIGKSIPGSAVDVDLGTEPGTTTRVSRRQALVRLQEDGQFFIKNIGKNHLFVNGKLVGTLQKKRLHNHALIEISDLCLLFVKLKDASTTDK